MGFDTVVRVYYGNDRVMSERTVDWGGVDHPEDTLPSDVSVEEWKKDTGVSRRSREEGRPQGPCFGERDLY